MLTPRVGKISVRERDTMILLPCTLHETPTLIETFKSHNHMNLIKAGDIGQSFIVHSLQLAGEETLEEALENNLGLLTAMEQSGDLPQEMQCGLTPPMTAGCVLASKVLLECKRRYLSILCPASNSIHADGCTE